MAATPSPSSEMTRETNPLNAQARKLLDAAGSPELAKHAVDAAACGVASGSRADAQFAARWGFVSYLALTESSTPVGTHAGKNWCLTSVGADQWILWNNTDFQATEHASREEAERQFSEMAATAR